LPPEIIRAVEMLVESLKQKRTPSPTTGERAYPLRGTPIRYDQPFGPAAWDDWEAMT